MEKDFELKPRAAVAFVKRAKSDEFSFDGKRRRIAFFVSGETPLCIEGKSTYYPFAPNVKVSRGALVDYLEKMVEAADSKQAQTGESLYIVVRQRGNCIFV